MYSFSINDRVYHFEQFNAEVSLFVCLFIFVYLFVYSLKVAKQCMQESDTSSTFEGMEACAQTIESSELFVCLFICLLTHTTRITIL